MEENVVVTCAVTLQWSNSQGMVSKKLVHKVAQLRVLRDNLRRMFVEIAGVNGKSGSAAGVPQKFALDRVAVHKKFIGEGKASIQFLTDNCTAMLSNAPLASLSAFLRIILVKISGASTEKPSMSAGGNIKERLKQMDRQQFDDISPVTNVELEKLRKSSQSKATTTTPSPQANKKRPRVLAGGAKEESPRGAKLFKPSRLIEQPQSLNDEQKEILQSCLAGKNIFFTGSAGTGKSYLLRRIIAALPPDGTVATASTGVAACLISGMTLHAFAGIGSGEATMQRCLQIADKSPACAQLWRKCKTLIIDEISMVDAEYFTKIEAVARHVRRNEKPFGGVQLILCGDFLQLPPVTARGTENKKSFCFQSPAWIGCVQATYELQTVHRQSDPEFVSMLNLLRIGRVTDEVEARLMATSRQRIEKNGILATQLCSHTKEVTIINQNKLEQLEGATTVFEAQDSDRNFSAQLDSQVPAPGKLELKVGAQVMLLKNVSVAKGLVNGARGVVASFEGSTPRVRFKSGEYLCKLERWTIKTPMGHIITRTQVPLKLAWAFSIHKAQGLTLDCVEMSLSRVFEAGQAYVALSRAQSLESIRVLDFDAGQVWANPEVLKFYRDFRRNLNTTHFVKLGPKTKEAGSTGKSLPRKIMTSKPLMNIS